ncbi:Uncharacterised protein [Edwardsiella hoshinae]|uniref:Uncharacterized protein n=1 Tax=Edwardsiella hoshinae TaxID=93378 RepID=A0A376DMW1_9GAMM|nr:Uncharacterised protein [Edwardsiella hoshinae]
MAITLWLAKLSVAGLSFFAGYSLRPRPQCAVINLRYGLSFLAGVSIMTRHFSAAHKYVPCLHGLRLTPTGG